MQNVLCVYLTMVQPQCYAKCVLNRTMENTIPVISNGRCVSGCYLVPSVKKKVLLQWSFPWAQHVQWKIWLDNTWKNHGNDFNWLLLQTDKIVPLIIQFLPFYLSIKTPTTIIIHILIIVLNSINKCRH